MDKKKSIRQQFDLFGVSSPPLPVETKAPAVEVKPSDSVPFPAPVEMPPSSLGYLADWQFRRWKEFTRPHWRAVLNESIEAGDKDREKYARFILCDVLGEKI